MPSNVNITPGSEEYFPNGDEFLRSIETTFPDAGDFVVIPAAVFQLLATRASAAGVRMSITAMHFRMPE